MAFKRSTLRYGEMPEPVTPYQKAAQVWDQRIGTARAQAHSWRLFALGCLAVRGDVTQLVPVLAHRDLVEEVVAVGREPTG